MIGEHNNLTVRDATALTKLVFHEESAKDWNWLWASKHGLHTLKIA